MRAYTAACFSCPAGHPARRFDSVEERQAWVDLHRGHRVMVGEVNEPEPQPIARVRYDDVGNEDSPDWRLLAAVASRTRAARLGHAAWCLEHAAEYTDDQVRIVRGIEDGTGDGILQKCLEHGVDPE